MVRFGIDLSSSSEEDSPPTRRSESLSHLFTLPSIPVQRVFTLS